MRVIGTFALGVSLLCVPQVHAQNGELGNGKWEVGVVGGGSFFTQKTLTNGSSSANAGFDSGYTIGTWLGNNLYDRLGGELRYGYAQNDAKLESGSTKVLFGSRAHTIGYNVLLYTAGRDAKLRGYVLAGAGLRHYEATGQEVTYQQLNNVALLTRTTGYSAVLSIGGGVRFKVGEHGVMRVEFVDYLSPFPDRIITPRPNTQGKGWLNNFVPMVGLAYTF
jgi:hypothetical protein